MTKNLKVAIEAEAAVLRATAAAKADEIRRAAEVAAQAALAEGEAAVRQMVDRAYGGVLRPWKVHLTVDLCINPTGANGGWVQGARSTHVVVLASSADEARAKAPAVYDPGGFRGGGARISQVGDPSPAWDEE